MPCVIGGVNLDMIIDSGSKSNIIDDKTWKKLKGQKIQVKSQEKNSNKIFRSYANNNPLEVLGSFKALLQIKDKSEWATFYVIKNGLKCLLGKDTAIAMGVLKIGLDINSITEPFPKLKNVIVDIPINQNITPVIQPYRRIPIPLEDKVNKTLEDLLNKDIIEAVNEPSKWVSPIVPILKENGEVRICVDMRRANKAILRENHPLPTMDALLPQLRKAKLFSRLDLKNAFHQIEISENSRYITTFISKRGLLRYKRLMFGITCAPEMFQKIMEKILAGCEGVLIFIDDIIIYGESEIQHDERVKKTLERLKSYDVLLNNSKCIYKVKRINFLGHTLTDEGVKPLKAHVDSIQNFRAPKTVEEIQSFLGTINFVGKWIPNLATLTEPIRMLLRKNLGKNANISQLWQQEQEEAFIKLKKALSCEKILGYYDPKDRTQVIADASPVGLGCILIQFDNKGPRVIAYGNKSLTDCEKRYCQTEKEALALVWSVEHFCIYLFGLDEFELVTDHKPLETIFSPRSKPCARIERWVLRLQSFTFKVVYRPGKSNIADSLSRLCCNNPSRTFDTEQDINLLVEYSTPVAVSLDEIKNFSKEDSEIIGIRNGLYEGKWDETVKLYKIFEPEFCFVDNILLRGNKIVIPKKLRPIVLDAAHQGHPGIVAMKSRLRTKVWWPKIDKDAEGIVKSCKGCTLVSTPDSVAPLKRRELPLEPWMDVAMDFLGPLPTGDYLFVVIDYFSRYKEIKIMNNITTDKTITVLKDIFSRLGYPLSITADNGRQFACKDFKTYCKECGIKLYNTIPYWPQQNGEVERQNRDILKRLKISHAEKRNWKDDLNEYLIMYNSTPHSITGKTPSELFFGRQFRDKIPSIINFDAKLKHCEVRDRDKQLKEVGRVYFNQRKRTQESDLQVGNKVYLKNQVKENKLTTNFSPVPHTIVDKFGGDVTVQNDETGQSFRRNVLHLKKIEGEWKVQDGTIHP